MDLEDFRRTSYEIAEAIAPGWERRRGHIEEVAAPVREWMIRELGPRPGDRWRAYRRRTSLCLYTPSMAFALMTRAYVRGRRRLARARPRRAGQYEIGDLLDVVDVLNGMQPGTSDCGKASWLAIVRMSHAGSEVLNCP
jgi:hypothetical protein